MHFRSALLLLLSLLIYIPSANAQKRVFATVNPNAAALENSADIYDPGTGTVVPTSGKMNAAREQFVAVAMHGGRVLIAGGYNNRYLKTAEVFNPATGTFAPVEEEMTFARVGAVATLLQGGGVLIAGGYNGSYLTVAEIYDPTTETFTSTNPMSAARQNATATRMSGGKVLVAGGFNGSFLNSAEIYDTAAGDFYFSDAVMSNPREWHAATLLSDGTVLITGGCNNSNTGEVKCDNFLDSAEIYDPSTDSFYDTGSMSTPRINHTATLLADGKVLITGGSNGVNALDSAEIFDPDTGEFSAINSLQFARMEHTASILPDGKVLIAGGEADQILSSIEIYNPSTGAFSTASAMSVPRSKHAAVAIGDGRVLLAGGEKIRLLRFDTNYQSLGDDVSPNVLISPDSKTGFVSYSGSGTVLAFSTETGEEIKRIVTGGNPAFITPLSDGRSFAVVSALDNRIFVVDMQDLSLKNTYTFGGYFGFGSRIALSPDGSRGYVSSTQTGEVIKFDASTFGETGRLTGMQGPAQITVMKDGSTLLVVDVLANEVVFVDASTMTAKYKVTPQTIYSAASFTISNKAVLNADETLGIIASQDSDVGTSCTVNALFVFKTSSGKIVNTKAISCYPADTILLPDGSNWLVLGKKSLSIVPTVDDDYDEDDDGIDDNYGNDIVDDLTDDPEATVSFGESALASANMVLSADQRYVYYGVASVDAVYQQDITTKGVVGSFAVGDNPDIAADQTSALAITPDWKTMVAVNFASNELALLSDTTLLRQIKYVSQNDQFTGLSIVNLSDADPANLTITLLDTSGKVPDDEDLVNPITVQLAPNAQKSVDVSQLFSLNTDETNAGRLLIESDQPAVAGFSASGKVRTDFFDTYISSMVGFPIVADYRESLHDFIIPEIPTDSDATVELNFVNPNYNTSYFDVTHYVTDGTVMQATEGNSIGGSLSQTNEVSDFVTVNRSGRVIIAGGYDAGTAVQSAYQFQSPTFYLTNGILYAARYGHTATQLQNEQVLVVGGRSGPSVLRSAELYNPVRNEFLPAPGSMSVGRYRHSATRLPNGKVLIAGGQSSRSINDTAELYDSVAGAFEPAKGHMTSPRDAHTATLLNTGKVLIAGGIDGIAISSAAELYNSDTSTFQATGSMNTARVFHTAVSLPNGKVLIAGGYNGSYLSSVEIYDPSTGVFTLAAPMAVERANHSCTLLSNGTVLIAGGKNASGSLFTAEIYDPSTGRFSLIDAVMNSSRHSHTATLLNDDEDGVNDKVLLAGGFGFDSSDDEEGDAEHALAVAELYNPATQQFSGASTSMERRQSHTATLLGGGDQGYLRVESDIGLLLTEVYSKGGAPASINGINVDKYNGVTRIFSPKFSITSDFVTLINIINSNKESGANITLTLHASDGSVLDQPLTFLLARNAQLKGNLWDFFRNDESLLNQTGWLEVASDVDRVVGAITFTDVNSSFLSSFELSGTPLGNFLYPLIAEDSTYQTQIALLNSGSQTATVDVELYGTEGLSAAVQYSIAPGTSLIRTLTELFQRNVSLRPGNVRIRSSLPLHSFAAIYPRDRRFMTSEAPVPYPESAPEF